MKFNELCRFFFNKIKATLPSFSESWEKGLDKVVSRGEKNFSVHKRYMNFLRPRKTALDEPLYKLSAGRSMVEMLGVLAIIGVLSVGAIAGYSKAMMKYKLNKQAEQLNNLLSIMSQYRHEWKFDTLTTLTPYYIKMGLIPEDMIQSDGTLQDVFGSTITLRNNYAPSFSQTMMSYQLLNNNYFEVCQNIYQNALNYSPELSYISVASKENASSATTYSYKCYGDTYCSNPNLLCCKNLTLSDFADICKVCDQKSSCSFTFIWNI